jgi:HPt (histidine-containing phosphotransfer) domain-containing protein
MSKKYYFCSGFFESSSTDLNQSKYMKYQFINTEYLETVSGGDKEMLVELAEMFRNQVSEMVHEMHTLYGRSDFYSLAMLAHKAKSSVAIMGMNNLATMLKTFELEGKEGKNSGNYISYIDRYEREANLAVLEFENYVNNL